MGGEPALKGQVVVHAFQHEFVQPAQKAPARAPAIFAHATSLPTSAEAFSAHKKSRVRHRILIPRTAPIPAWPAPSPGQIVRRRGCCLSTNRARRETGN